QPEAHAGAALGAVAQAGGVDVALGRGERDLHRYPALDRLFRVRLDVDAAEVVQRHQRLSQAVQAALVVVLAFLPVDEPAQQALAHDALGRLFEIHATHVVAVAAGPDQVDVGGVLRARDLHAVGREIGVEVAALGQAAGNA